MCEDVAVSRNGKWLAVASKEIISLYDASTLDCLWSRDNQCEFISFSPDDCQLVSGHIGDGKLQLINVQTGNPVKFFNVGADRAVFSDDGTRVISGELCIAL